MPFQEVSRMQNRQRLAELVLSGEASLSEAARRFGVSRPTAYLWVRRARERGVAGLQPLSRRPHTIARCTPTETEALVLAQKEARPAWGAKKIHAELWPDGDGVGGVAPVCVRTVDRLLRRHGLAGKRGEARGPLKRFEREGCNQLWQIDFKAMGPHALFLPLSVLDDCSRFCLALLPVSRPSSEVVWSALWEVFGEYGVPECILSDNGDCFNSTLSRGPTPFQARLWRLGVKTLHGRPAHPQTQGKVERFHRTLEEEYRALLHQRDPHAASRRKQGHPAGHPVGPYETAAESARIAWEQVRQDYNWARPHEALSMRTPGSQYAPSPRKRPDVLPPATIDENAAARKVDVSGQFGFQGRTYRAGRGLAGEWVEIREGIHGYELRYASVVIAPLEHLQVERV